MASKKKALAVGSIGSDTSAEAPKTSSIPQLTEVQRHFLSVINDRALECVGRIDEKNQVMVDFVIGDFRTGVCKNMGYKEIIKSHELAIKKLKKKKADEDKRNEKVKQLMKRAIELRKKAAVAKKSAAKKPSAK